MVSIVDCGFDGASTAREIPGPRGKPFLGVIREVRRDRLQYFVDLPRKYGDVVKFKVGPDQVFMFNHPKYIRHVLQDNHQNYHKSHFYSPLKPILGDGLFLAEDTAWVNQRRTASKGFQGPCIHKMCTDMTDATADMLGRWQTYESQQQAFDCVPEMMRLTLDIVLRSLLGVRLGNEYRMIYDALSTILRDAEGQVWSVFDLPRWVPTRRNQRFRRALRCLDEFVHQLIENRRKDPETHSDFLSLLIDTNAQRLAEGASEALLRDQVLSIILAGHETTANSLSWMWYLLSRNPHATKKLREEVDRVLEGRVPTFEDVPKLTFAKQVFDETLRLYPTVWTISRTALEDDYVDGIKIPKGTTIMLSPYAVHRRAEFWPNPEGFDPDRFAPDAKKDTPRHAYFPFGGGPRTCLGSRFAAAEVLLIMAMVVQRYDLTLVPGRQIEPEPMITLRPRGEVLMELRAA